MTGYFTCIKSIMADLSVKFCILMIIATCAMAHNNLYNTFNGCDYYENIELNRFYDVFSPFYPGHYQPGTNCRWSGCAPPGTNIVIRCTDMGIQTFGQCDEHSDRLEISYKGCQDLSDASRHCTRPFLMETRSNALVMALRTFSNSTPHSGRFFCKVNAQPVPRPAPQPINPWQWGSGPVFPTQNTYVPVSSSAGVSRPPSYVPQPTGVPQLQLLPFQPVSFIPVRPSQEFQPQQGPPPGQQQPFQPVQSAPSWPALQPSFQSQPPPCFPEC